MSNEQAGGSAWADVPEGEIPESEITEPEITGPEITEEEAVARRARMIGTTCLACAMILGIVAALFLWGMSVDGAYLGAALVAIALAVLMALLAVIAYQAPRPDRSPLVTVRSARFLTFLILLFGIGGVAIAVLVSALVGSGVGALAAGVLLPMSLLMANAGTIVRRSIPRRRTDA